jgi:peptide subunit release factor 1 (eRF1)
LKLDKTVLRKLAQLAANERTILSIYLDLTRGWDEAETYLEKEKRRLLPVLTADEKDYFETSISFFCDTAHALKEQNVKTPGLAFFADLGAEYTCSIELDAPPDPLIAVDDEAILHPLALILDEYERVGIIMIDASGARILIAAGERMEDADSFKTKIHHLSKVGGWSQIRYQRRREKQVQHFAKDIAERAAVIFQDESVQRIIFAGRDRMVTALEREFPRELQKKVIATIRWDLSGTDLEFLERIRPIMEQTERDQEEHLLNRFIGELRRGGLAVSGIEATRRALDLGQVDTLFLSMGLREQLTEELVSKAETTASYVEFVPQANSVLQQQGGIAALLRYKIRT